MTDKIVSARAQARTTRFSTFDVDSTLRAYARAETIFRKNQRPEIRKQGPRHVLGAQRVLHPHEEVVKLFRESLPREVHALQLHPFRRHLCGESNRTYVGGAITAFQGTHIGELLLHVADRAAWSDKDLETVLDHV
jgi:hypothetical protein